jgi:hypothetical protein
VIFSFSLLRRFAGSCETGGRDWPRRECINISTKDWLRPSRLTFSLGCGLRFSVAGGRQESFWGRRCVQLLSSFRPQPRKVALRTLPVCVKFSSRRRVPSNFALTGIRRYRFGGAGRERTVAIRLAPAPVILGRPTGRPTEAPTGEPIDAG